MQKATKILNAILKIWLKKIANKQFYEWICRTHIDSMELFQLSQCHKLRWIRRKDDTIFQIFYPILRKNLIENLIDVFYCCSVSRHYSTLHDPPNCFNDYLWAIRRKGKSKVINCPYFQIITKVRVYFCCTRVCSIHSDEIQYLQLNFEINLNWPRFKAQDAWNKRKTNQLKLCTLAQPKDVILNSMGLNSIKRPTPVASRKWNKRYWIFVCVCACVPVQTITTEINGAKNVFE